MAATDITGRLAKYMVAARTRRLAPDVARDARHRILDSLAAMVSGAHLKPGEMAIKYARAQGGVTEATVVTTDIRTTAVNAALANAMFAHADETDDFHPATKAHPGCSVVPAALAMAEREGSSGIALLNAVTLGYDLCCRFLLALDADLVRATHRSAEGTSSTMGSVGAAAALARLDEKGMRHALSYAAQQASGISSYGRDLEHVEKAFDFGGMPARNGVTAATLVASGCTGVDDVFTGERNFFHANDESSRIGAPPDPQCLIRGLGRRWEIAHTNIKRWSVGSPIQAPLDSLLELMRAEKFSPDEVDQVVVRVYTAGARIANASDMPDINMQHLCALMLVDGTVTFKAAHDVQRMRDPRVLRLRRRIRLVGDPALEKLRPEKHAIVEVTLKNGRRLRHHTRAVRGSAQNPMTRAEVVEKALDLMAPVLDAKRAPAVRRDLEP